MDLHQLFVFTKVVEHQSFSKAAEDIFLSQSTVSSHIQSLEKMLNVKLFDRLGREIILTPHGEKLYVWAQKLLFLKDKALLDVKDSLTELNGTIKIAASSVPGQFLAPDMIKNFRKQYPHVTFHLSESSSKNVAEQVLKGKVDIGILGGEYENSALHYTPLFKDQLVLITSKEIDLPNPVGLKELLAYPFVLRSSDSATNALIENWLKNQNIPKDKLTITAYTDSGQSLAQFVKQGIGISIISNIAAEEYSQSNLVNKYELADFTEERSFYLVYNKNKTLPLVAKLFVNEIVDSASINVKPRS